MCQPKPGPRCSAHMSKRKIALARKIAAIDTEIAQLETKEKLSAISGEKIPAKDAARLRTLRERRDKTTEDLRIAVRDYDGTKTGAKELRAKMEATTDPIELRKLARRLKQGAMLRSWRQIALERKQAGLLYSFDQVREVA